MTLPRTIFLLAAGLATMLAVVVLRAETTRVQFLQSQPDRRADVLLQELREQELEIARLRDPLLIRERAASLRVPAGVPAAPPPAAKKKQP